MIRKKSEEAVSPVIGVMLLLVVTIIIAAVVAVFASGVGTDAEPAPTTVLNVVDVSNGYDTKVITYTINFDAVYADNSEVEEDNTGSHLIFKESGEQFTNGDNSPLPNYVGTEYVTKYLTETGTENKQVKELSVTLSAVNGDVLDLSKVTIKVYGDDDKVNAEYQGTLSETLIPGDTKKILLTATQNGDLMKVLYNDERVDVVVLYGDHVIVNKEMKVTRG